jgi:hypothetical protein
MGLSAMPSGRVMREVAMFVVGGAGFLNEVYLRVTERPFIIAACLALMGLPFVLHGEDRLREKSKEEDS